MRKLALVFLTLLTMCSLSGCFLLYRPVIQQGNILSDDAIAQLHPGMTMDQVLYLMGTPMLTNTFQPERLDYVYTSKVGNHPRQQRHVTLFFTNNILQLVQVTPMVTVYTK